ncbi:MAG: TIGR02588 family protein, partial [Leptolyngbya sp. ERB_1_2]
MEKSSTRSPAEWVTFGIASTILGAVAGLVLYVWISDRYKPAAISVEQREIRKTDGKFYVPFEVTNTGGETVESVQVIAELKTGDRVLESGDQQIDFLSKGEKEEGAFVFQRDPRQGELVVRVA